VALFVFLMVFDIVPTVWHHLFIYWTLEMFRQCNILFLYVRLEPIRECGIIWFSIELWNCSDSVALLVFHFSIGLWNCSDSVALLVFIWEFETVPIVWHYLFFLLDFETVPTV
jgi:hypothetical protein